MSYVVLSRHCVGNKYTTDSAWWSSYQSVSRMMIIMMIVMRVISFVIFIHSFMIHHPNEWHQIWLWWWLWHGAESFSDASCSQYPCKCCILKYICIYNMYIFINDCVLSPRFQIMHHRIVDVADCVWYGWSNESLHSYFWHGALY